MTTLTQLAEQALESARKLDAFAETSFQCDTLSDLPPELETERKNLVDASQAMKRLSLGAVGSMLETLFTFTDLQALHYIYHNKIPAYVPAEGDTSFEDVAKAAGVDPGPLRRFLQHAMASNFFVETRPGFVGHSPASLLLRNDTGAMDTVGFLLEDLAPAALQTVRAYEKWPNSSEPNETGFNVAEATEKPFYRLLADDPERSRRFGAGMRFMTKGSLYDLSHLVNGYDWAALNDAKATVVDVGGGHGSVSIALAKAFPALRFVVQDLEGTVHSGKKELPAELQHQVNFMPHDFFSEQPVHGADVYFFRFIFHNWADKYATKILHALIPALKPGARIVIYEFLPDAVATTKWSQKQPRNLDMIQALGWNSLERTQDDWAALFDKAGAGFQFIGTKIPPGSAVSLIEASWRGADVVAGTTMPIKSQVSKPIELVAEA
ncbi:O-methyltransferase AMT9 [Fulvia fulva]|uniref:O-methyltransferase AMT9 n=1 Tax=Passalora fulva TaxID=5499 RepID=A0A9Q8PKT4_PASFU|nr:O-methyltransferase AMT9 [Fulvia fulva]KAK4611257.1 O-methyltransferase AMT9 [Fulvia fulva]UJO24351.1 O-methyltransferase AMT9 [Fulvia fulva]